MDDKEKEKRKSDILDAVIDCQRQAKGAHVQASQVAARAGISTRTLNRYFADYDLMILEAAKKHLSRCFAAMEQRYRALPMQGLSGRQRLIAFMQMQIQTFQEDIPAAILYIEANIRFLSLTMDKTNTCPGVGKEIGLILIRCIESGIRDGSVKPELDPAKTALLFSVNFNGLMQRLLYGHRVHQQGYSTNDLFFLMGEYVTMMDQYLTP